ncbi:MAG: GyrI-like domain-containing protein [Planctomycetes bacterium]|nr:GyrI-like domain-containing protein [Planctomycetota bacterium]MBI3848080.1 GyrI-like domain-containing protein [Planctomycetota bacterium]
MPATKLDLYKAHKADYAATRKPAIVDVGKATYLAIAGKGEPGGAAFNASVGALYAVAFTIKMAKKHAGRDYAVSKLEGLWWTSSGKHDFSREPKSTWRWKLLIRTPAFVTKADVRDAQVALMKKGKGSEVEDVALEAIDEGRCVQVLHVGPYDAEAPTIEGMKAFGAANGLAPRGLHHEIYLSDPRRVPPTKLKTILRMPVG